MLCHVLHHRFRRNTSEVIGNNAGQLLKPEVGDLRQHRPLARNRRGQDHVKSRQAIRGDNQHLVRIYVINIAHLALVNQRQTFDAGLQ